MIIAEFERHTRQRREPESTQHGGKSTKLEQDWRNDLLYFDGNTLVVYTTFDT